MNNIPVSDRSLQIDLLVPCFNEADSAPHLIREIEKVISRVRTSANQQGLSFGIIVVDDGSSDKAKEVFQTY